MTQQARPIIDQSAAGESPEVAASPKAMRRIAVAGFIGTTIEFTDFNIYALAAALVFPTVFFPALGPAAGTIASLATLGVAFIARPVGSILFGHFGDRIGRKKTLVTTLLVMGLSTVAVGFIPSASTIGILAPILLIVLRVLQGLAVGGEWAGAVLFAAESAPKEKRGFWAMFPGFGGGFAAILAASFFLIAGLGVKDNDAFLSWGWRIPFIFSIVLVAFGLWVRLNLDETPVFKKEQAEGTATVTKAPFLEAFRSQPREIILASGMVVMGFVSYYTGATYLTNYATTVLGQSRNSVLAINVLAGVFYTGGIFCGGMISDRLGRRRVMLIAGSAAVIWALLLFPFINTGSLWTLAAGSCITMFITGFSLGPLGAYLSELFQTRYRYTAAGFCYNVAGIIGGAIPPLISAAIVTAFGGFSYGIFVAALCFVSLTCAFFLKETKEFDLNRDNTGIRAIHETSS